MRRMIGSILVSTAIASAPAQAQEVGWVAGEVIDQNLAITLPGVPVEAVGTGQVAYTDLDGRYRLELPPGTYDIRIVMAGYAETNVTVEVAAGQLSPVRVALGSNVFAEELVVTAPTLEADSSTAAAQMMMRMRAPSVQDNIGAIEMSANNDSNAADAMQRVTGVSVVEGQSVFVRGLGERYSNTTLAGATLPTTEPDRRVVPLDLFPTGLIDSVQVSKTYTPDKPSQFAGGLVEIVPMKLPDATSFELSAGGGWNSLTTGAMGLGYPVGGRDWLGFDDGTRALPTGFPDRKVTRGGRFSGTLGFSRDDLERMGEQFANVWDPQPLSLPIDQSYNALFGGRFGNLGIVATLRHAQGSQFTEERRTFYKVGSGGIEPFNGPYDFETTEQSGTVGAVGNIAYQFTPNQRLSFDNFYTHVGTNETRRFQGYNDDAGNDIRNQRLWWVEERIASRHVGGDHLFPTPVEQPPGLEDRPLARRPRRAGPARGPLRIRSRAPGVRPRRRIAERTPAVQRPDRRHGREQRQLEHALRAVGRPGLAGEARRQLHRPRPRLPLAPAALRAAQPRRHLRRGRADRAAASVSGSAASRARTPRASTSRCRPSSSSRRPTSARPSSSRRRPAGPTATTRRRRSRRSTAWSTFPSRPRRAS